MRKIFVIGSGKEIKEIVVSEFDWKRSGAFSTKVDGKLVMVKHGRPILEGFYSGFESKEEAEQLKTTTEMPDSYRIRVGYRNEGHPYS